MDSVSETAWIPCRAARVAVDTNADGSYTPREVIVVLHSAGMLVERRIPAPDDVRRRTFGDRETAAEAALAALELGRPEDAERRRFRTCGRTRGIPARSPRG